MAITLNSAKCRKFPGRLVPEQRAEIGRVAGQVGRCQSRRAKQLGIFTCGSKLLPGQLVLQELNTLRNLLFAESMSDKGTVKTALLK